ncbi:hypothetical protein F0160_22480 [Paraburkholderia sp. JPY303]|uniref:hypothetical protein n=1 Tax=Paraburkholderia atlantica TaxID=2654982 RepID=UPI0015927978|nr:hypothetical protein [Paraburkholderia atlantica]NUY33255.1 hypothetical protein [Paraburkholderia atlantica]
MSNTIDAVVLVATKHISDPAIRLQTDKEIRAALATAPLADAVLVSRADLLSIYAAMNHLGDVLNGMDAVESEDEAATEPGFAAIRRALGEPDDEDAAPLADAQSKWHPDFVVATYENQRADRLYTMDQMRDYADAFHRSRAQAVSTTASALTDEQRQAITDAVYRRTLTQAGIFALADLLREAGSASADELESLKVDNARLLDSLTKESAARCDLENMLRHAGIEDIRGDCVPATASALTDDQRAVLHRLHTHLEHGRFANGVSHDRMAIYAEALGALLREAGSASADAEELEAARCDLEDQLKAQYNLGVQVLNALLDCGGADENHKLAPIIDMIGEFISSREAGGK